MLCKNQFPIVPSNRKIAIIGEAPGADEERIGQPFSGYSGKFLRALLSRAGLSFESCFVGNIAQHRPANNDFSNFQWFGPEVQSGLEQLKSDLESYDPNLCVLLGNVPLKAAKDVYSGHPLIGKCFKYKVSSWRGSFFLGGPGPFENRKCMPSYHPAYVNRDYELAPFLQLDLNKASAQSGFRELKLTARTVHICRTLADVRKHLREIRAAKQLVSCDLEGYFHSMTCIGFGVSKEYAFVIPLKHRDNTPLWPVEEIIHIWRELAWALEDPELPKTFQYGLYDTFVLHYGHGIRVLGYRDDTIHKHWELYSELAKADNGRATARRGMGLAIQASIYTDMPYYKDDINAEDDETHYHYCGTDCLITKEVSDTAGAILNGPGGKGYSQEHLASMREHYEFNGSLLPAFRYLSMRGIRYDAHTAAQRCEVLKQKIFESQARLNALTGFRFSCKSLEEIKQCARAVMLTKKGDRPLKPYIESWERFNQLLAQPNPSLATIGEIENLCEVSLNIDSPKQFNEYLYVQEKLPVQYNDDKNNPKPTSDYEALLRLAKYCKENNHRAGPVIALAIEIRALATRIENLAVEVESDFRMRFSFNIVGSNTGRTQCGKSATGRGRAGQGVPNYTNKDEAPGGVLGDRDLFCADTDHWFFQCDLKGADGWTVAAYAAMLGDPTMLDDYLAGLKPANIMACILRGWSIPSDRSLLRELCKKIDKDAWDYFACKRVQHGASYLEGAITISRNILTDSEGKCWMTTKECEDMKELAFFHRYPGVRRYHNWIANLIGKRPILQAASGQVRQFFGRPDEILTKAVAFEPQANTTYATNLALRRLWNDPENRILRSTHTAALLSGNHAENLSECPGNNRIFRPPFRVEPLHQIHDALCGQFPKANTDWSIGKIQSWFNNSMLIAGRKITIPFDGTYGKNWGMKKEDVAGKIGADVVDNRSGIERRM